MRTITTLGILALIFASCSPRESTTTEAPATDAKSYPLETCLVSGEELGSMGEPHGIVYEGREIKFCCDRCEPKFRENPEKYLSQLDTE